jgi:hypothetical protein
VDLKANLDVLETRKLPNTVIKMGIGGVPSVLYEGHWLDGQDTIPGTVKNCSPLHLIQTHSGAHPVSNARGTVGSVLKVTPSVEIKNIWSYTIIPPKCHHKMVFK